MGARQETMRGSPLQSRYTPEVIGYISTSMRMMRGKAVVSGSNTGVRKI